MLKDLKLDLLMYFKCKYIYFIVLYFTSVIATIKIGHSNNVFLVWSKPIVFISYVTMHCNLYDGISNHFYVISVMWVVVIYLSTEWWLLAFVKIIFIPDTTKDDM